MIMIIIITLAVEIVSRLRPASNGSGSGTRTGPAPPARATHSTVTPNTGLRFQHLRRQDRLHRPDRLDPTAFQHHDVIAVLRRQIHVMDRCQGGRAHAADEIEYFELVADVEVIGGLVEDQDAGFLDECPRNKRPLLLSPGQCRERPCRQRRNVDVSESVVHALAVVGGLPGERRLVGAASHAGGGLLAAWGGPKRRMDGVLRSMMLAGAGAMIVGLRENLLLTATGIFIIGVSFVFVIGLNRVIWQAKAAPDTLGRMFSLRVMLGVCAQSLGIVVAGPLAERVFEPAMAPGGSLADIVGPLIGTGPGRGMALMYIIAGVSLIGMALLSMAIRSVRRLEDVLPDQNPV